MNEVTLREAKEITEFQTNQDIEIYLKKILGLGQDSIEVIGELSGSLNPNTGLNHFRIHNVRSVNGIFIEYPISDLAEKDKIKKNGIYVPFKFDESLKKQVEEGNVVIIKCHLIISTPEEREKHNNPFLLNVDRDTIQIIKKIEIIKTEEGHILIEESVVKDYLENNKIETDRVIEKLQNRLSDEISTLHSQRADLKKKIEELSQEFDKQTEISKQQQEINEKAFKNIKEKNEEIKSLEEKIYDHNFQLGRLISIC